MSYSSSKAGDEAPLSCSAPCTDRDTGLLPHHPPTSVLQARYTQHHTGLSLSPTLCCTSSALELLPQRREDEQMLVNTDLSLVQDVHTQQQFQIQKPDLILLFGFWKCFLSVFEGLSNWSRCSSTKLESRSHVTISGAGHCSSGFIETSSEADGDGHFSGRARDT